MSKTKNFNCIAQDSFTKEQQNYIGASDGHLVNALLYYKHCLEVVKESEALNCPETGFNAEKLSDIISNICNHLEELNYVCHYTRSIL